MESASTQASTHGVAEVFAQRIALLKVEFMDAHQARDVAEAYSWSLSGVEADTDWR
jgi:hypothetical protein